MIIGAAIFALLLGAYVFLVLPRARVEQRVVSVGVFLILIGLVYGGATELLSRPKPLRLEWRDAGKTEVISAVPIEDEAIYLWLSMPDEREPRAYVLPWSRDAAQQLQDATNKAEADGGAVEMAMSRGQGPDTDDEPLFYARPQPPMPEKDYRVTGPLTYARPGTAKRSE
jgi:hypothetical protein